MKHMPRTPHPACVPLAGLAVALCALLLAVVPSPAHAAAPPSVVSGALQVSGALPVASSPIRVAPAPLAGAAAPDQRGADVVGSLRSMLRLVNVIRSTPQVCGKKLMPAVRALNRNKRLNKAARRYAKKMARLDWFDHDSPDGTDPGERMWAEGYRWSRWGENIAAGYDTVPEVLAAWMASPGHCRILMGGSRHVGFGYGYDEDSTFGHYWVQDFASPR